MMDIANRQQQFFLANRRYATTLAELSYALPADVDARYAAAVDADNDATPPTFTVNFTAEGSQADDGDLSLDNTGAKTPAAKW
jgi:type IV pilus assembly protein PilE